MTKKKQKKSIRSLLAKGFGNSDLSSKLQQLRGLISNDQCELAETLALKLHAEFPQDLEVIRSLVYIYSSYPPLENSDRCVYFLQKAIAIDPNNPKIAYDLGFSYLEDQCAYFYHGVQCLTHCLERWPNYQGSENARALLKMLEEFEVKSVLLNHFGLAHVEDSQAVAQRCEQFKLCENAREYAEAQEIILSLIADFPDATELKINLAEILLSQHKLLEAIALLEKTIASDPTATSVVCLLIKYYLFNYQIEAAEKLGEQLKSEYLDDLINKCHPHDWVSIFDALTLLREDAIIVKLFETVEAWQNNDENKKISSLKYAIILHFVATSFYHLGDTDQAHILMKRVCDLEPEIEIFQNNLADFSLPPEEQNGLWAFEINEVVFPELALRFSECSDLFSGRYRNKREQALDKLKNMFESILSDYPYLYWLCPYFLDRGSNSDRVLFQSIAFTTQEAQFVPLIEEFILKEKGSKQLREELSELSDILKIVSRIGQLTDDVSERLFTESEKI